MKMTKKLAALMLALLMAIAAPFTVWAETQDPYFQLSTVQTKFYAGLSYDVTATITNATKEEATGNDHIDWSVTATAGTASIATLDNYKPVDNGNGTYTVTETATLTMPQAGATATVTATFGSRSQTLALDSLQPIDSFDVVFDNTDCAYFDSNTTVPTLYLDRNEKSKSDKFADFSIRNITPSVNDDELLVAFSGISKDYFSLTQEGNDYSLSFTEKASGTGYMNFSVSSGNKSFKNYNVQVCIPATQYKLDVKGFNATSYTNYGDTNNGDSFILTNLYTGKAFSIRASGDNLGNDDIRYELYTDSELKAKAPATYLHKKNNRECELNITEQGTYWLVSKNYSKDNGMLKRELAPVVTTIVVNQSVAADSITLYELDEEGNKTDTKLKDITLYTNTNTTRDIKPNLSITPDNTTDNLIYTMSSTAVATVSNGVITAKAKGDAVLYIKSDENANANAALNIHVRIGVKAITKIAKQDNTTIIPSGHVQQLLLTTNPAVIDEPVYWSSTNRDVLSVDRTTGRITANDVTDDTVVTINAISESGQKNSIDLTVVPANRAASLALTAETTSATCETDTDGAYLTYRDYYRSTASARTSFTVTADAPGENGGKTNDEYVWQISYNNGAALTLEEAKAQSLITYTDSADHSLYLITPQKQGIYSITCTATTNIYAPPAANDPSDTILIEILQTASTITVKDAADGKSVSGATLYIPIGSKREITVKTSTADNNKTIDPPTYKINKGEEYINFSEQVSADGEGMTYTIEGLSYSAEAASITFSSLSGSKTSTVTIYIRNNLNDAEVRGVEETAVYTGSKITFPDLTLYYNGGSVDSAQYNVDYKNSVNVGTATIIITGKSEYNNSKKEITFRILPKPFDETVTFSNISDQKLTDTARESRPSPTVYCGSTKLKLNTDYVLSYKNNLAAGTATVIATGIGNYTGSASTTFKILDTATKFNIAPVSATVTSGKEKRPAPTVKYNGVALKKDVDYTLTYKNNTNPGLATITVTGTGKFYGTTSVTFTIKPKQNKFVSMTKTPGTISAKWQAHAGVSGYQVQYATKKNFKKGKKTFLFSYYYTSSNFTGMKKKKVYYFRVRSYVVVNGKNVYGKWSKVKKIKAK